MRTACYNNVRFFIMPWIKAFVIGNGTSRLAIDLNELRGRGTIYGCNALYRDFTPDVLVATDDPIAREIEKSGYPTNNVFYTRKPDYGAGSKKIEINFGYSSGPIAASLAAKNDHHPIYLIGFDFTGINGKFNNVYAGTNCYKAIDSTETYFGNWINQFNDIFTKQFPHKRFIRVINDDKRFAPDSWHKLKNYSEMNLAEFKRSINSSLWQKQKE